MKQTAQKPRMVLCWGHDLDPRSEASRTCLGLEGMSRGWVGTMLTLGLLLGSPIFGLWGICSSLKTQRKWEGLKET